jgi:hypothetical protein
MPHVHRAESVPLAATHERQARGFRSLTLLDRPSAAKSVKLTYCSAKETYCSAKETNWTAKETYFKLTSWLVSISSKALATQGQGV